MNSSDFFAMFPSDENADNAKTDGLSTDIENLFDQMETPIETESTSAPLSESVANTEDTENFAQMFDELLGESALTTGMVADGFPDVLSPTTEISESLDLQAFGDIVEAAPEVTIDSVEPEVLSVIESQPLDISAEAVAPVAENIDNTDNVETTLNNTELEEFDTDLDLVAALTSDTVDGDESPALSISPLLPSFLVIHKQLEAQVAQLNQQVIASQRRFTSTEQLVEQQAQELTQVKENLVQTVAELQVHQEETKRQRLQVETLTEKLSASKAEINQLNQSLQEKQAVITDLEQQVAQQTAATVTSTEQNETIAHLEKHVQELRSRLQRQQRFALQYKSALEQCLAQPDFYPSSDVSQAIASLLGKSTPASEPETPSPKIETAVASTLEAPTASTQMQEVTAVTPQPQTTLPTIKPEAPIESAPTPVATTNSQPNQPEMPSVTPVHPHPHSKPIQPIMPALQRRQRLSFAVQDQPSKPRQKSIELPKFLRRSTVTAG